MDFKTYLSEAAKIKHAFVVSGRYNPPTIGHMHLFKQAHEAAQAAGGDLHVVASHSEGTSKNPLPQEKKMEYLEKVLPKGTTVSGTSRQAPTIFHTLANLHKQGYTHVTMVSDAPRTEQYKRDVPKYNNVEGRHGFYNFKKINFISGGERNPDDETGIEGVSATKAREHALAGRMDEFKKMLPPELHPHAEEMANHIKLANEDYENPYRFDDGTPEGTAYMRKLTPGEKSEATEVTQDPDIKGRPGTQPAKYHTGLSKGTKAVRDAQFKRQAKMDSRDPAAYKKAPGDNAKTKPSKYTTAYKRKFGESKIPVLLMNFKQLVEETNEVEYDTVKTKHFDMCPGAVTAFSKHIEDANNGVLFIDTSYIYQGRSQEDPLIKQRELLKAALEATDSYLSIEKEAVKNDYALPAMMSEFDYHIKRAMQTLEIMGVLQEHDYIQSHIDTMNKLSTHSTGGSMPTNSKFSFAQKMYKHNVLEETEIEELDEAAEKGLAAKAAKSGVSLGTLRKVYKRGVAAWRTGHRPGTTPQQWGMARVNSYLMKGKGTYHGADKDLREDKEIEEINLTEEDLEKMADDLTWEDIEDFYSKDELVEEENQNVTESLSMQARIKKRQTFARFRGKRGVARGMKLRRASDISTLQRRAKMAARRALYQRFLKGRPKSQLSAAEKDRIEDQVARLKVIQTTLAQKMMPKIRSIEQKRLSTYRTKR